MAFLSPQEQLDSFELTPSETVKKLLTHIEDGNCLTDEVELKIFELPKLERATILPAYIQKYDFCSKAERKLLDLPYDELREVLPVYFEKHGLRKSTIAKIDNLPRERSMMVMYLLFPPEEREEDNDPFSLS